MEEEETKQNIPFRDLIETNIIIEFENNRICIWI